MEKWNTQFEIDKSFDPHSLSSFILYVFFESLDSSLLLTFFVSPSTPSSEATPGYFLLIINLCLLDHETVDPVHSLRISQVPLLPPSDTMPIDFLLLFIIDFCLIDHETVDPV